MPGVRRIAGVSQGIAQAGVGVFLHAAVGESDIALLDMHGTRPGRRAAGQTRIFEVLN